MDKVATLDPEDRKDLFQQAAAEDTRDMNPAIIEKDFWVCWVLKKIFSDPHLKKHIVFKGGTSLSKVFGLIDRFSEDIDLILDWTLLGYGAEEKDPYEEQPSRSQQDRFSNEFKKRAGEYIAERLCPQLIPLFSTCNEVSVNVDPQDGCIVNVK